MKRILLCEDHYNSVSKDMQYHGEVVKYIGFYEDDNHDDVCAECGSDEVYVYAEI